MQRLLPPTTPFGTESKLLKSRPCVFAITSSCIRQNKTLCVFVPDVLHGQRCLIKFSRLIIHNPQLPQWDLTLLQLQEFLHAFQGEGADLCLTQERLAESNNCFESPVLHIDNLLERTALRISLGRAIDAAEEGEHDMPHELPVDSHKLMHTAQYSKGNLVS